MYLISKVILAHWLVFTKLDEKNFMVETQYFLNFASNECFFLFFPIFAVFEYCNICNIASICNIDFLAARLPLAHQLYSDFSAHCTFFNLQIPALSPWHFSMLVFMPLLPAHHRSTATAADVEPYRTSIPPRSVISLWQVLWDITTISYF